MTFIVSIAAVAAFAVAIWKLHVLTLVKDMPEDAMAGISAMFDKALDDEAKERAVQQAGLKLIGTGGKLFLFFGIALVAAAVPIYLCHFLGLVDAEAVFALMLRLDYIIGVSVAATIVAWLLSRGNKPDVDTGDDAEVASYGVGDRMVHTLAFSSPGVAKAAARLDDKLFEKSLAQVQVQPPVFITSLARGGTTAVLNAMHGLPQFATHHYRDMPFVSAPLLWARLSGKRKDIEKRQRAHGDGMEIDLDSPEAFDEIFWMLHWPEKYAGDRIGLWKEGDGKEEARTFFQSQFRKLALLRRPEEAVAPDGVAYLSKNNANIARLRLLPTMFPGCETVIPLRGPAAHAASLHRQHMNFLDLHGKDAFGQRYMRDIGHFEFGTLHKPINFEGFSPGGLTPQDPDYWLTYWIAAFRDVAETGGGAHIISQDNLRADPDRTMHALLERLGHSADTGFASHFRRTPDPQPVEMYSDDLLRQAQGLYDQLAERCVGAVAPATNKIASE